MIQQSLGGICTKIFVILKLDSINLLGVFLKKNMERKKKVGGVGEFQLKFARNAKHEEKRMNNQLNHGATQT